MGGLRFLYGAVLLVIAVVALSAPVDAAGAALIADQNDEQHSAVTYVATALLDVFYVPAKVLIGSAGVVTSSLAYVVTVGDTDTFSSVWDSAVMGDYVLTPRMIEGKDGVHFAGSGPAE